MISLSCAQTHPFHPNHCLESPEIFCPPQNEKPQWRMWVLGKLEFYKHYRLTVMVGRGVKIHPGSRSVTILGS